MNILPNYLEYQKSIAIEFKAYEKRVRNLIDDTHWGEEGRYKEIILMNYLKRVLPKNLSVGTGFVRNGENITSQIDIIIYDNSFPILFAEGDFVIATPENVIGIIEVKSTINPWNLCNTIEKANRNGSIICNSDQYIFNGIFSYNSNNQWINYVERMKNYDFTYLLQRNHFNQILPSSLCFCVNHIVLGDQYFLKLWETGQSSISIESPYYSIYDMEEGLSFSYFLSNLQDLIIKIARGYSMEKPSNDFDSFFYPIPDGKETRLLDRIYLNN